MDKDPVAIAIGSAIVGVAIAAGWFINLPVAGAIIGVLAGAFLTNYTTTRTQRRTWKREFMLKAIEIVYGPLYNQAIRIDEAFTSMTEYKYVTSYPYEQWKQIKDTYIYYMLDDDSIRRQLEDLYNQIEQYNNLVPIATRNINSIIEKRGSEIFSVAVDKIRYIAKTPQYESGISIETQYALLHGIHPLQHYANGQALQFEVDYKENGSMKRLTFYSKEDFDRFEGFWKLAMQDVSSDPDIQKRKILFQQISSLNTVITKKLVEKIQEQWKI